MSEVEIVKEESELIVISKQEYLDMQNIINTLKTEFDESKKIKPNMANLFLKIQKITVELQELGLKPTGFNAFAKFSYYTLKDFLPSVNKLCLENKVFIDENIGENDVTLTVIDCEDVNNRYTLKIPTVDVDIKGGNLAQCLASKFTYFRRYAYLILLSIVEEDTVDAVSGSEKSDNKAAKAKKGNVVEDNKTKLKNLCTELSQNGKKQEVLDTLQNIAGVKNPNSITDESKIVQALKELEAL